MALTTRRDFLLHTGIAVVAAPYLAGCVTIEERELGALLARLAQFANYDLNVLGEVRHQLITDATDGMSSPSIAWYSLWPTTSPT